MRLKRPQIILDSVQFKSLVACEQAAKGIQLIEEYTGIHSTTVTVRNPFICPDINLEDLNKTPAEELLRDVLALIRRKTTK